MFQITCFLAKVSRFFQGWEETTDAALTFLLRTSLAKVGKENQGATPITLEPAKDTSRIKKHVSSVVDRITKGTRITDDRNKIEAPTPLEFSMDLEDDAKVPSSDEATPVGSHFGEAGERLRSARTRDSSSRPRPILNGEISEPEEKEVENEIIEDHDMNNNNDEDGNDVELW